jgi:XTP/dITP diphosphohydrolase
VSALPSPLLLATGNADKVREWRTLVPDLVVRDGLPSPDETGATCEENARLKAVSAALATGLPALGDDVGLDVEALGWGPGKDLKPWAEALGGWDAAREALARLGGRARYHCALAIAWPDGRVVSVDAVVSGRVGAPAGHGPGVEPCFTPDGATASLSELPAAERAERHHRHLALRLLHAAVESACQAPAMLTSSKTRVGARSAE